MQKKRKSNFKKTKSSRFHSLTESSSPNIKSSRRSLTSFSCPLNKKVVVFLFVIVAFLAVLIFPILEVITVKFIDPIYTPLMGLRKVEAYFSNGTYYGRTLYEWTNLNHISRNFLRAVCSSEDGRFFKHHGFDWIEFHQAMAKSERTGKEPRGTSTITMQCARSLFLWQGHSYFRKGLEAYYTYWMEVFLTKRRILELYSNIIEMGDGIYGIEAASKFYYLKSASSLSRNEAAMLAALLPNPRHWKPRDPNRHLLKRQQRILQEMSGMHLP